MSIVSFAWCHEGVCVLCGVRVVCLWLFLSCDCVVRVVFMCVDNVFVCLFVVSSCLCCCLLLLFVLLLCVVNCLCVCCVLLVMCCDWYVYGLLFCVWFWC